MKDKSFIKINPEKIRDNFIRMIGYDWMLITAGPVNDFNTMTAAWGGMGFLWNKAVAYIFVRPQRFTYKFTEKYNNFTLCFFEEKYRKVLSYCGTHSGRDVNKVGQCNLTILETGNASVGFSEARYIIDCRSIYATDIKEEQYLAPDICEKIYPQKDFHRLYIGEILDCYQKLN